MLRWNNQWGKNAEHWQHLISLGREVPAEYYECPDIEPHLNLIWSAFWDLSTERQIGMGIGPIPVSKISEYLIDEMELCGPEFDRVKAIIRRVDGAYVGIANGSRDDGPEMADSAKATDGEGVKRVVSGLGERFKQARKPIRK